MSPKTGRPPSDSPKDFMLRVRLDEETLEHLDKCCEIQKLSRSQVVRNGIQGQYDRLKTK